MSGGSGGPREWNLPPVVVSGVCDGTGAAHSAGMRLGSLRAVFRRIVVAASFAGAGVAGCSCPPVENTVLVDGMLDEYLAPLVERCRASADDCEAMCRELVDRFEYQGAGETVTFTSCE